MQELSPSRRLATGLALLIVTAAVLIAFSALPEGRDRGTVVDATMTVAFAFGAWAIFAGARSGLTWRGDRPFAFGLALLAAVNILFLANDIAKGKPFGPSVVDLVFLVFLVAILGPAREEFVDHFARDDRREISGDTLLISVSLSVTGYVFLRPIGADSTVSTSAATFAVLAATQLTCFTALALWVPTRRHIAQAIVFVSLAATTYAFGWQWVRAEYTRSSVTVDLALTLGGLALAAASTLLPRTVGRAPTPTRFGRPLLATLSVMSACAALGTVAELKVTRGIRDTEAAVLIALLAAGVSGRILVNQLRSSSANRRAFEALRQKDAALAEADSALDRVREANETLRQSEEHLRLVFETAVDGVVELDANDEILRANEAFCRMVGLPRGVVEGQRWSALAAAVKGADAGFAQLPSSSSAQGTLQREGQPLYLESRTSQVPMTPPRRLLLIRDVTAGRVADQTIRSLFQYLQDRDEDRTRILRRMNSMIEAERHRFARDLHDGPVQGVSAASLSLEAALLMIRAGEVDRGLEVLGKIRRELSEEADGLRRLMSGMRPPLLEERGLIPAIRETLVRFGTDNGIETEFSSGATREVPRDMETLAYRVVQEALSNAGKHAKASRVSVNVVVDGSQLRVEVVDNGVGFEAQRTREYLRMGRVGLAGMRERVELASGTFGVLSTLGRGTTIVATLPLDTITVTRELAVSER